MKNILFIFGLFLISCVLSLSNMDAFIMGPEYDLEFESGDTEENFLLMNDTIVDYLLDGLGIEKYTNNTSNTTIEMSVNKVETPSNQTEVAINNVEVKKITQLSGKQENSTSTNNTKSASSEAKVYKLRSEIEILSKNDSIAFTNTYLRNPIIPDPIANQLGRLDSKSDIVNLILSILTISLFLLIFIGLLIVLITKVNKS